MQWTHVLGSIALACAIGCDGEGADDAPDDGAGTTGAGSSGAAGGSTTSAQSSSGSSDASTSSTSGATGMTTTDGSGDESTESGGSTGAPAGGVPVFFAAGDVGRTTYSCDLGLSWTGNRSFDLEGDADVCGEVQPVVCYDAASGCQFIDGDACESTPTNCDCDHHPGAVQGVAYGDGWWVATWGWGPPGSVRRSQDGMQWETVVEDTTFGGLAYGNGTFMAGSRQPRISVDGGATWTDAAPAEFQSADGSTIWNLRRLAFAQAHGGHFVAIAADGGNTDMLISSDAGGSWWRPEQRPGACLDGNRGILSSQDAIVLLGGDGDVCTSVDGGQSWSVQAVGAGGSGVWDGERFWWWSGSMAYTSPDGMRWDAQATKAPNLGAVAVDPSSGVFVAVRGGWQNWYDAQEFYRSEDGLSWTPLEAGAFEGSHRIRHIAFAQSDSGVCE